MRNELALASYESRVPAILSRFTAWVWVESLLKPSPQKPLKLMSAAKRTLLKGLERKLTLVASPVGFFSLFTVTSLAQTPATRMVAEIDDSHRVVIHWLPFPFPRNQDHLSNHHFGFDRRRGVGLLWRAEDGCKGNLYPDHHRQGYRLVLDHGFDYFDPDHRLIRSRY
jgi:hypothetical protein